MNNSFQSSRDRLLGRLLDFLWTQWTSLGVAGNRGGEDDRMVDPEALLLVTTRFGRYDPRLLDEVIDWLNSNGKRINLQRLRRLHAGYPVADLRVLAAVSQGLVTQSMLRKWRTLSDPMPADVAPEPLFIHADGSALPVYDAPDPDFRRHGLLRNPVQRRRMSQPPDPAKAMNLLCSLRALFGVNSRAEIIAWLLTHESGHPAAIARDTGYFSKSIQHTLNEMEDSGHIRSHRDGREKRFWLQPGDWSFLILWSKPRGFPQWIDWMPIFSATATFIDAIGAPGLDAGTVPVQAIQLRQALDTAMPALSAAGLAERLTSTRGQTATRLLDAIRQDLGKLETLLQVHPILDATSETKDI